MHRGGRIGALFGAVAAAGALVLLAPNAPSAHAIEGSFTYTGGDGKPRTSSSPPLHKCVAVVGSGPVRNMTNAKLTLYDEFAVNDKDECDGKVVAEIEPGQTVQDVSTFQAAYWED